MLLKDRKKFENFYFEKEKFLFFFFLIFNKKKKKFHCAFLKSIIQ
jgi:hypothetical protein